MSGIWGWFGGSAAQKKKDTPKNAILNLRRQKEMLEKRAKHVATLIEEQDGIARKNVNSNKNIAKSALRRKKAHEHTLDQTEQQIHTLQTQMDSLENAHINVGTLQAMKEAGVAMGQIQEGLTPEKVDDIMDKLRDQVDVGEEIQRAMANAAVGPQADEEDLDAEFAAMQQEQLDKEMLTTGSAPINDAVHKMPAAGNAPIPSKPQAAEADDEEEEIKKLQAEMAM